MIKEEHLDTVLCHLIRCDDCMDEMLVEDDGHMAKTNFIKTLNNQGWVHHEGMNLCKACYMMQSEDG